MSTAVQIPKANPWGKKPLSPPTRVSLLDIQQQEQTIQDFALAVKLQQNEETSLEEPVVSESPTTTEVVASVLALDDGTDQDAVLAAILQAEFDAEHDHQISIRERLANLTNHKVSITMDNLRRLPKPAPEIDNSLDASAFDPEDEIDEDMSPGKYDKTRRVFRDNAGQIITKHNAEASHEKTRQRVQALHINTGDMEGSKNIRLSAKVFNSLKSFADKSNKSRCRIHEHKEFSTSEMALDPKTRLLVFKMINSGGIDALHGSISAGKESVVFHAERRVNPEDLTSAKQECAVKVFKTTLTDFKGRAQFLNGDRRFDQRVGKQHTRQLVKLWAEKEMSNLSRMSNAGLPCPQVFLQKKHVLVMSFIGSEGKPAPKLREAGLTAAQLQTTYGQVVALMRRMYNDCKLVHADLSEYNILYHDNQPWIIDVGQAIETAHPRANEYFYNDCCHITDYFDKNGVEGIRSAVQLFNSITGHTISSTEIQSLTSHIKMTRKEMRNEPEDVSNVCLQPIRECDDYARNKKGDDADEDSSEEVEDEDWETVDFDGSESDDDDEKSAEDIDQIADMILAIKQRTD